MAAFSLAYSFGHGSSLSREEKVQQTQIAEKNQKKMYKEKKKKEEGILLNFFEENKRRKLHFQMAADKSFIYDLSYSN